MKTFREMTDYLNNLNDGEYKTVLNIILNHVDKEEFELNDILEHFDFDKYSSSENGGIKENIIQIIAKLKEDGLIAFLGKEYYKKSWSNNPIKNPIIFCRVGWMKTYNGLDDDSIINGGAYININKYGHEIYNFLNCNNKYYGFVQAPGSNLNLNRINKKNNRDYIDGICIVWVAKKPKFGGQYIVGWYNNARVYKKIQPSPNDRINKIDQDLYKNNIITEENGQCFNYWFETNVSDGVVLPEDRRTFKLSKSGKGGMGQANIWYADQEKDLTIRSEVNNYINKWKSGTANLNGLWGL
jgi:hypothetical protein